MSFTQPPEAVVIIELCKPVVGSVFLKESKEKTKCMSVFI